MDQSEKPKAAKSAITVVIADDHAILREGLIGLLSLEEDIKIAGSAVNGADAVEKVRELKPNVLLLDLIMPEMDGVSALEIIVQESPDTRTIILTGADDDELLARSIQSGAVGYLLKDVASSQLINAIRTVAAGGCWLPTDLTERLVRAISGKQKTSERDKLALLTQRELEVLKYMGEAYTNSVIGEQLFISEHTVKVHVSHVLEKMGFAARQEAVKFCLRYGLIKE
ncbi:MAG: response regulator transcription factor [Armatimonadota bacterium]|nr:response regulator transcription factor [Armatimonadota bacterium]